MTRAPNRNRMRKLSRAVLCPIVLRFTPAEFAILQVNTPGPSHVLGGYAQFENILIAQTDADLDCHLSGKHHERLRRYCSPEYGPGGPNARIRAACIPALRRLDQRAADPETIPINTESVVGALSFNPWAALEQVEMPMPDSKTETATRELITPDMARQYLQRNSINRRIRPLWVKYLSKQMQDGQWELTSDGIGFYADGTLANGQHRLTAVIDANMPVAFIVVRNVSAASYLVTDRGVGRSMSDVLALPTTLVADANLLIYLMSQAGGRHTEIAVHDVAIWWRPAYDTLLTAINHTYVHGFSSAGFRVGCGVRWAVERDPDDRQYVLDQFVAIQRNEAPDMSVAGATLWKRWVRDKYGGGRLSHRLLGAVTAFHYLDPARSHLPPFIKSVPVSLEALRDAAALLEGAFAATLPTARHPYEALRPQTRALPVEAPLARPAATDGDRPAA